MSPQSLSLVIDTKEMGRGFDHLFSFPHYSHIISTHFKLNNSVRFTGSVPLSPSDTSKLFYLKKEVTQ